MGERYANSQTRPAVRALAYKNASLRDTRNVPLIAFRYFTPLRLSTLGAQHAYRVRAGKGGQWPSKNSMVAHPNIFCLASDRCYSALLLLSVSGNGCQNGKQEWATSPWACQTPPTYLTMPHMVSDYLPLLRSFFFLSFPDPHGANCPPVRTSTQPNPPS